MSCGKGKGFDNCVCETVRKIVEAQNEVAGTDCCNTGCDQSISDLLSPSSNGNRPTTIPFALYCKGDCEPFIGSGIYSSPVNASGMSLQCVRTPIFRAKKFVDDHKCCVQLELLLPVNSEGETPDPSNKGKNICDFFPGDTIRNLQATGICLTVDLNCFCGILCLDPTTPIPSSEFDD
ncbi:CotY/CotZ family spore coat protein [Halobacillus massiliensis]|uniref:CotY/CotZ family spore coat protein n=1 Tax=Halobacillus massiliensis TaxID=1926286 RepID=UPI0009E27D66|nr:CotY/CotZ family spore coat protein [Halobacillus massiliensis]